MAACERCGLVCRRRPLLPRPRIVRGSRWCHRAEFAGGRGGRLRCPAGNVGVDGSGAPSLVPFLRPAEDGNAAEESLSCCRLYLLPSGQRQRGHADQRRRDDGARAVSSCSGLSTRAGTAAHGCGRGSNSSRGCTLSLLACTILDILSRKILHACGGCCMKRSPSVPVRALTVRWRWLDSGRIQSLDCRSLLRYATEHAPQVGHVSCSKEARRGLDHEL